MFTPDNNSLLKRLAAVIRLLVITAFVAGIVSELAGCSGPGWNNSSWKNYGDSCINTSEKPPLQRVINYTDHDLCGRKLSPRKAPNPQTRPQTPNN
ncbi:MAG: hypothetical protein MAG581_01187 [Deltaproteobacteria bacterium]|jgi:hypothetical protein|nr:hypothetical protein [Deltaproteobacteria bacterium]